MRNWSPLRQQTSAPLAFTGLLVDDPASIALAGDDEGEEGRRDAAGQYEGLAAAWELRVLEAGDDAREWPEVEKKVRAGRECDDAAHEWPEAEKKVSAGRGCGRPQGGVREPVWKAGVGKAAGVRVPAAAAEGSSWAPALSSAEVGYRRVKLNASGSCASKVRGCSSRLRLGVFTTTSHAKPCMRGHPPYIHNSRYEVFAIHLIPGPCGHKSQFTTATHIFAHSVFAIEWGWTWALGRRSKSLGGLLLV